MNSSICKALRTWLKKASFWFWPLLSLVLVLMKWDFKNSYLSSTPPSNITVFIFIQIFCHVLKLYTFLLLIFLIKFVLSIFQLLIFSFCESGYKMLYYINVINFYVDFVSVTLMNSYLIIIAFWFLQIFQVGGYIDSGVNSFVIVQSFVILFSSLVFLCERALCTILKSGGDCGQTCLDPH